MHASFAWIIAEDSVNHDFLLVLVEPPVLAAEAALRLGWGGGHPECGDNTDYSCEEAFECEQISPASFAIGAADVEEAKC